MRRAIIAALLVVACKAPSEPGGFGLNVRIEAGAIDAATRARIVQAALHVTGDETYDTTFNIAKYIGGGEVRFRYVPGIHSGMVSIAVDALAADGTIVASGVDGPVAIMAKAVDVPVVLGAPSAGDMGAPPGTDMGLPQGSACTSSDQCGTAGGCVDGYCCDTTCTGQCQACDVAGTLGTCTPVSGTPHGTRPSCNQSATCGGMCDGTNTSACAYPSTSVICGAACDGHCDGMGGCTSVTGGSCPNGFACGSGGCKTSCSTNSDCQPNFTCNAPNCVRVPESDCLDGKDNNGDGLADCQDPTCTSQVACVPSVPAGDELGIFGAASCPSTFPTTEVFHQGLTAPMCTSNGCGCDVIVTCQVSFGLSQATDCSNAFNYTQSVPQDVTNYKNTVIPCSLVGFNVGSVIVNSTTYQGTGCAANGSSTPPPISWSSTSNFCAVSRTSATCDTQHVCAPKPPQNVCVRIPQSGAACPAGYAGQSATWYAQAADTRSCTCGCNVTQAGDCNGNMSVGDVLVSHAASSCPVAESDTGCSAAGTGVCKATGGSGLFACPVSSPVGAIGVSVAGGEGGQCGSNVSTSGTATPAGASTVCCQ